MSKTGTPVKVIVETKINRDGQNEQERYKLMVFGHFYKKNDTDYLIYDEVLENDQKVRTVFKYKHDNIPTIQLLRRGAFNMALTFRNNEMIGGSYKVDKGAFSVQTNTKAFSFQWDDLEKQGSIRLKYDFLWKLLK